MAVERYAAAFQRIIADPRYERHVAWGVPRPGHPEGTIRAHIADLERNLETLRGRLSEEEWWRLRLLAHTHDTLKPEAREGAPIGHSNNHATLGAAFLAEFIDDPDLIEMARLHDEPYALWRRVKAGRGVDEARLELLLARRWDWELFAAFLLIDGLTEGKSRTPLRWFLHLLRERGMISRFGPEDAR